ncbi:hypothetical protein [Stackebrandtia soli]|uniref:hypothetical protein n=1 Tax=Stackebrandtia soli TaxID=1892856 RepID=UPI0039EA23F9
MKRKEVGIRTPLRWISVVVVVGLLVAGGYRAFADVLPTVPVDKVVRFLDGKVTGSELWLRQERTACGFAGGSCVTREDRCDEQFCADGWGLFTDSAAPARDRIATVHVVAIRDAHRFEASLRMTVWQPEGWIPYVHEDRGVSVDESVASVADEILVTCIYNVHSAPADSTCSWSVWLRYGQYVFGLQYFSESVQGSEEFIAAAQISESEFIDDYVFPFDRFLTDMLRLD